MSRRKRQSKEQWIVTIAILALFGIGAYFLSDRLLRSGGDEFGGVKELDVDEYLENANSLLGNTYVITGVVDDLLRWTPDSGRLFSIKCDGEPMAVLVPREFSGQSIDPGEEFKLRVEVRKGGTLVTRAIKKI